MANQLSKVGFGMDARVCAAYAQAANDRLGPVNFVIHNTGTELLTVWLKERDGTTSPSGYKNVATVAATTVVAGGQATIATTLLSKQVGFFGSGESAGTHANITVDLRNPADLRGAQIDIVPLGHRGFGWDDAFDKNAFRGPWGSPPDSSGTPAV